MKKTLILLITIISIQLLDAQSYRFTRGMSGDSCMYYTDYPVTDTFFIFCPNGITYPDGSLQGSAAGGQPFDSAIFNPNADNTAHNPYKLFADTTNNTISLYNENTDVTGQLMQELWTPEVINKTGSTLQNGTPVYIDTTFGVYMAVDVASCKTYEKSRLIGVVTEDVLNDSTGFVTLFGYVNNVPLTGITSAGIVYLGDGVLTGTKPTGGNFVIRIGFAQSGGASGTLFVYPGTTEYTDELIKAFGFPTFQETYTTLNFNDDNRYLSIVPYNAPDFYYYQNGIKYINEGDSIQIPDTEGLYAFYYDEDVLTIAFEPNGGQIDNVIRNKTIVAYVYWDATNKTCIYLANERHTFHFESWVHAWAHFGFGTRYNGGIDITDIIDDGNGSSDTHAQFGVTSGVCSDEDIATFTPSIVSTTGYPIYYLDGIDLNLRLIYEDGFPVLTDITAGVGVTGRLVYNDITTGTLTTVTNNDFVLAHLFEINSNTDSMKIVSIVGQNEYSSAGNARAGAETEIQNLVRGDLPAAENKELYSVIFQTGNAYGNAVKARIRPNNDDEAATDWRFSDFSSGSSSGSSTSNFIDLSDVPNSYIGFANYLLTVTDSEAGLEYSNSIELEGLTLKDSTDNTKELKFSNTGITTGNTRILTVPDKSGTIALTSDIDSVFSTIVVNDSASIEKIISPLIISESGSSVSITGDDNRMIMTAGEYTSLNTVSNNNLDGVSMYVSYDGNEEIILEGGANSDSIYIVLRDNRDVPTGLEYAENYRKYFVENSLVDKGFVDSLFSDTTTLNTAMQDVDSILVNNNGVFGLPTYSSDPTAVRGGQMYWNSTAGEVRVWNGSSWVAL